MKESDRIVEYDESSMTPDLRLAGYSTPGWYFWDETDAYCHGPYQSREEAATALREYAETL